MTKENTAPTETKKTEKVSEKPKARTRTYSFPAYSVTVKAANAKEALEKVKETKQYKAAQKETK